MIIINIVSCICVFDISFDNIRCGWTSLHRHHTVTCHVVHILKMDFQLESVLKQPCLLIFDLGLHVFLNGRVKLGLQLLNLQVWLVAFALPVGQIQLFVLIFHIWNLFLMHCSSSLAKPRIFAFIGVLLHLILRFKHSGRLVGACAVKGWDVYLDVGDFRDPSRF